MTNNAFGLPRMKKDVKNHNVHARTSNPHIAKAQAQPIATEQQNSQQQAVQQYAQATGI